MNPAYQYAGLKNPKEVGLSVEQCTDRLHRLAYVETQLMFIQAAHIISTPERDIKALLSRSQYEDGQHADRLKHRLTELRVSQKRAFIEEDAALAIVFEEALHAHGTTELLAALTLVFKPALKEAYRRYIAETNGLADYGSVRAINQTIVEEEEISTLLINAYQDTLEKRSDRETDGQNWANHLKKLLDAVGGIDGTGNRQTDLPSGTRRDATYSIPRTQTWDDAFPRVWDIDHVDENHIPERLAQMICTRLGELTIAESLSFVLCETKGQPWSFYLDISRHQWDEMRHSMFGEAAIEDLFDDRAAMPLREWETEYLYRLDPLPLYAMLCDVEAGLMKYPPGKRFDYEFCRDQGGHPLMTTLQDFDWADEVLHVNIARRQLKTWFTGSQKELLALAESGINLRSQARTKHPPSPLPSIRDALSRKTTP